VIIDALLMARDGMPPDALPASPSRSRLILAKVDVMNLSLGKALFPAGWNEPY
jgi:hypothetical protein